MASVNKVILIGNLGKDPEVRYTPSGRAVVNVTFATSDRWKDKNIGEKQERTEWHHIVFYSPLAEIAGRAPRCTSRAACRPASGRTKPARTATPPKSSSAG